MKNKAQAGGLARPFGGLPLLLYSALAAEILAPFFASFLILYGIFFLIQMIPLLDAVLALQIGAGDFFRFSAYMLPNLFLYLTPLASMTAVILGFTRMSSDGEILALKACGVSFRQMLPPLLVFAAAIALLTLFFSVRLIPLGEMNMKQLIFQLMKEKIDKGLKEKEFTEALGDLVVYVDRIDASQGWHGVYVSDMRGRRQPIITMAKSGRLDTEMERMQVRVVLEDGVLHSLEGVDNQVLRFKKYQLHIPLRPPTKFSGDDLTKQERNSMTQAQLIAAARKVGEQTKAGRDYLVQYQQRLSMPLGCFFLCLIAAPLGMQARTGRRAIGLPLGLVVFLLYYVLFTASQVLSEEGRLPLIFGMWLPNALLFALSLYLLWRTDQERPLLPEKLHAALLHWVQHVVQPLWQALCVLFSRLRRLRRSAVSDASRANAARELLLRANVRDRTFHFPQCQDYNCPQCRLEFKDAHVARQAGFHPCVYCQTLMDPPEE